MLATTRSPEDRALLAAVVGTTASVMPAFLTGAVAVQLAGDLGLDDWALGLCIGGFFTSAALGSAVLGRAAEHLGGTRAMRLGLTMTMVTGLLLTALARSPVTLGLLLVVGGTSNALTQPAANLLLVERMPPNRLGFGFALKQAGMPAASMIGGALVPAVAVTVGWRWTYLIAASIAAAALLALPSATATAGPGDGAGARPAANAAPRATAPASDGLEPPSKSTRPPSAPHSTKAGSGGGGRGRRLENRRRRPDLPLPLLLSYAVVGLLGAAAAGAMTSFLVSSAEAAGVAEGPAGLLLTAGSAIGIGSRIVHGRLADGPRLLPIRRVIVLLTIGAAGLTVFALDTPLAFLLGLAPVFGAGWAWPGLFNLSIVRNNPSAPAAATGVSQTGTYVGAAAGPFAGGLVATSWGYPGLWLVGAAVFATAAGFAFGLRLRLRRHRLAVGAAVAGA